MGRIHIANPTAILARDYSTNDGNDEFSVAVTLITVPVTSEITDFVECMMLEDPGLSDFVGMFCINCHLKCPIKYPASKDDPDNILFMSWRLHRRIDGLNGIGIQSIPQFALKFVDGTEERRTFSDGVERVKVLVDLVFPVGAVDVNFTERLMTAVQSTMKAGSQLDTPAKVIHSFLWVVNWKNFKMYADFKYAETTSLWQNGAIPGAMVRDNLSLTSFASKQETQLKVRSKLLLVRMM